MAKKTFENKSEQLLSTFMTTPVKNTSDETSAEISSPVLTKEKKSEKKVASFNLSEDLLEALRIKSFDLRMSKSEIVEEALIAYLK